MSHSTISTNDVTSVNEEVSGLELILAFIGLVTGYIKKKKKSPFFKILVAVQEDDDNDDNDI